MFCSPCLANIARTWGIDPIWVFLCKRVWLSGGSDLQETSFPQILLRKIYMKTLKWSRCGRSHLLGSCLLPGTPISHPRWGQCLSPPAQHPCLILGLVPASRDQVSTLQKAQWKGIPSHMHAFSWMCEQLQSKHLEVIWRVSLWWWFHTCKSSLDLLMWGVCVCECALRQQSQLAVV